jgi:parallel beta-helix repeat protein
VSDYYVSTTGNDSNSGAAGFPWLTLQRAVGHLLPGDTLWVLPGTYNQDSNVNLFFYSKDSGTPLQRITYRSIIPLGAKVTSSGSGNPSLAWYNEGDYCDFIGFEVTSLGRIGLECAANHCRFFAYYVHDITASPGINGGSGMTMGGPGFTDNWIFNTVIDHIGNLLGIDPNDQVQGIYMSSAGGGIWNCKVSRASGWGLHLWHDSKNCSVYNNLAYNNGNGGMIVGGDGGSTSAGSILANNICYNNLNLASGGGYGLREAGTTGLNIYTNNCFFGNVATFGLITGGSSVVNSILSDPKFVNYQPDNTGDYHLLPSSPCIDAGVNAGAPPTDFYGLNRCSGNGTDIGPYELQRTTYHGAG